MAVHSEELYEIVPQRPYSLPDTGARFSTFPEAVDLLEDGVYRRLFFVGRHPHRLEVTQRGDPSRAVLLVKLSGKRARSKEAHLAAERVLEKVLGIRSNVRPFYRKFRNDPLLGPIIQRFPGLRIAGRASVWETLLQIVLSQQINLIFAHRILCELARFLGRRARFEGRLYFNFPSPARIERMTVRELRSFKVSRGKSETLIRLAKAFRGGQLSEDKLLVVGDEDLVKTLTAFKGVGRWTAEFTALRGLARFDVFPAGDLGVVKYLAQKMLGHRHPVDEQSMRAFAERWRPFRGLALIYAYAELGRRMKNKLPPVPARTGHGSSPAV